jgi:hypothetical protein
MVPSLPRRHSGRALLVGLVLLSTTACAVGKPGVRGPEDFRDSETSLLFIGSSYLEFNDVPGRVKEFADRAGHQVYIQRHTFPGRPLAHFASDPVTAELIRERNWDFIVLQDGSSSVVYPRSAQDSPREALEALARKAREGDAGTRVVWMMPWAFEDGMRWMEGRDESYEVMQLDIRERVLDWSRELDLAIAPVGMAFYHVLTTWDHGVHFLHDEDWNHASEAGSYLAAATLYATLFVDSVTEVEHRWRLSGRMARELREVASRTVLDSLDLWRVDWGG